MSEKVFYVPHRPAIRESGESSKLRIVYDRSVNASKSIVFLNECLETAHLCKIHLIRIRELERKLLRFHWIKNLYPTIVEINPIMSGGNKKVTHT